MRGVGSHLFRPVLTDLWCGGSPAANTHNVGRTTHPAKTQLTPNEVTSQPHVTR